MISRKFKYHHSQSFFLFGPRGTGKSYFLRHEFKESQYINLLDDQLFQMLLANPAKLSELIGSNKKEFVIIDEIQKVPALLDEVHRLIEEKKVKFVLTGSSSRKLKREGANLLAGRALTQHSYPFTAYELGDEFDLNYAMKFGTLPMAYLNENPKAYLASYISTYLKEEVQQEGLIRNIGAFARFLEAASFSQGQILNHSNVASDCSIERKTVSNYFQLLQDLLLCKSLDVFSLRAKRELIKHRKFYFFDAGVFRQLRPQGPLDSESELNGAALETLVFQELIARNEYQDWDYKINFWHTKKHIEVDFILYGSRGLKAIEVKTSSRIREGDLVGLLEFKKDYPNAEMILVYGGSEIKKYGDVTAVPADLFLKKADQWV